MNQRNYLLSDVAVFVVSALLLFAITLLMKSSVLMDGDPTLGWLNMVNLNHNAFHSWRFGHLTQLALNVFSPELAAERPLVSLALLLAGTIVVLRAISPESGGFLKRVAITTIPTLSILMTVGLDPFIFGSLCFVPLMTGAAYYLLKNPNSRIAWLALGILSVESSFCANQASIVPAALSLLLAASLRKEFPQSLSPSSDTWMWLAVILLTPAVITTLIAPMPFLPHYPKSAHVVPYETTDGYLKPLIGPAFPFLVLDRGAVRTLYGFGSQLLLSLAGALLLLARVRNNPVLKQMTIFALLCALAATLDTKLPEEMTIIAPIASVSRLLPWGTTYALTSLAIAVSALTLGFVVVINNCLRSFILAGLAAVLILSCSAHEIFHPVIRTRGLLDEPNVSRALRTPSAGLVKLLAESNSDVSALLAMITESSRWSVTPLETIKGDVSVYPQPSESSLASAKQLESVFRWSARRGVQHGDERLIIRFSEPISLRGLELDPGAYATDFPRGLLIKGGTCSGEGEATTLFEAPVWQGALEATQRGIPYFSPRNKVRVIFNQQASVECIFAYQTAKAPFDWSVASVGIIQ